MNDVRKWMGLGALVVVLACTVGEAPSQPPSTGPTPGGVDAPTGAGPAGGADAESRAAELLARAQDAYEAAEVDEALRAARELLGAYPSTGSAAPARWVAARAAFAVGDYATAADLARAYVDAVPSSAPEREDAELLVELAEDARTAPQAAVVGAVLPRSGPRVLVRYADWLLEGIELAVAEAERAQGREIRLVVADDGGGSRVGEAVRELERQGAVAIVGPLLDPHLSAAAGARADRRLVMVSPTATETPRWPETFSINANDPRGARELGQYAADLGFGQAALLYPRTPEFERKAEAFAAEFQALGGEVRAMVPFDSGTTTFEPHMRRILDAVGPDTAGPAGVRVDTAALYGDSTRAGALRGAPFALFVAAPQRDVPQIAPQVAFYGLDSAGVQLFGDEAWASATVRRLVPDRDLEGVIAASNFPPDRANAAADPAFVSAYESRYRQSLANPLPALGYDAAHMVLQALPNRMLTPRALAMRFELLSAIRGATGLLSVRSDRVVRTPYLVVIRDGQLAPAPYPWDYEMPVPKPPVDDESREGEGSR